MLNFRNYTPMVELIVILYGKFLAMFGKKKSAMFSSSSQNECLSTTLYLHITLAHTHTGEQAQLKRTPICLVTKADRLFHRDITRHTCLRLWCRISIA